MRRPLAWLILLEVVVVAALAATTPARPASATPLRAAARAHSPRTRAKHAPPAAGGGITGRAAPQPAPPPRGTARAPRHTHPLSRHHHLFHTRQLRCMVKYK